MPLETRSDVLMSDNQLSPENNHENLGKIWNFLLAAYSFNGGHTVFDAVSSQTGGLGSQLAAASEQSQKAGGSTQSWSHKMITDHMIVSGSKSF